MGVSYAEVQSTAGVLGEDPLAVFAYAAHYNLEPRDAPSVDAFKQQLQTIAAGYGLGIDLVEGWVQERGSFPGSAQQVIGWAQSHTPPYMDSTGAQIASPIAGAGYKYGTPTPAATTTAPAPSGIAGIQLPDLSSLTSNPLVLGGAGLALALVLFGGGRRR